MPVIKINGQQFALQPGPNRLGGGTTADVIIGADDIGIQAIVDLGADNRATIRNSGAQHIIRVNGMALGGPTPLIHGDKVEIAGKELFFADDAKVGATQFVSASDVAAIAASKRAGPARATAATGGRLVSLVDGKEYAIPEGGVIIGRDASADVVVAQTSVSRRHAQVIPSANGYVVNDLSTNGIMVNGEKVNSSQPLSRADVIRVGTEEFRFYADVAPAGAKPAAPAAAAPAVTPPAVAQKPAPAPVSPPTPPQRPATPPPAPKPAAPAPPAAAAPVTAPRPVAPPAQKPAAPPATPKPASPAVPAPAAAKTLPPAPATAQSPPPPQTEPAASGPKMPKWLGLVIVLIIAVAAVAAFLILGR